MDTADLQWSRIVADCLAEATEELSTGRAAEPVLARRIAEAFCADFWIWGRFDAQSQHVNLDVWPSPLDINLMRSATVTTPQTHPVLRHWLEGHTDVAMVSTLVGDSHEWRNSAGYDVLRRGLGCIESGGIRLDDGNGPLHMIGFARQADFSADETARLRVFRAPVVAMANHSEWLRMRRSSVDWTTTMPAAAEHGLTARELQVLELLAEGLIAAAIARRLRVSVRTVHSHLGHIYDKLGKGDRLSVVLYAQRAGLLISWKDCAR